MMDETRGDDWRSVKDEYEKSMRSRPQQYGNIEDLIDDRIRQRFGEMIYRATLKSRKR